MKINKLILVTLLITSILCGCATPKRATYNSLNFIADSVLIAKHFYEDYRKDHFNAETEAKLKHAYENYQKVAAVAEEMERSYRNSPEGTAAYYKLIDAVAAAANEIIVVVQEFVPKEQAKKLKKIKV